MRKYCVKGTQKSKKCAKLFVKREQIQKCVRIHFVTREDNFETLPKIARETRTTSTRFAGILFVKRAQNPGDFGEIVLVERNQILQKL